MTKYHKVTPKDNMKLKPTNDPDIQEKVKLKRIVSNDVVEHKPGLTKRLFNGLFRPGGMRRIFSIIGEDIVVPAIKTIVIESFTSGIRMAMGEDPSSRGYRRVGWTSNVYEPKTNYAGSYKKTVDNIPRESKVHNSSLYFVKDYKIDDRNEAALVLNALVEHADTYDYVPVAEYYDMIGAPTEFTDHNYGWSIDSIQKAVIVNLSGGGWLIKIQPLEVL